MEPKTDAKTILVVDDDRELNDGLREVLVREGYRVIQANNGIQAKEIVYRDRPDLVILDINLPVLNGLAAIRQILLHVPQTKILVFTVHDFDQTAKEIYAAGGHAYVSKGKAGQDLLRVIRELLQTRSSSAGASSGT